MLNNGATAGQAAPSNTPPVVSSRPAQESPEVIEARRRANIARWENMMTDRNKRVFNANIFFSFVGSFLFGAFTATCSFGLAYAANSVLGNFIKMLFVNYPTALLQNILPTFLAPYSTAILIAAPVASIGWTLYHGYKTNTLGFSNPDKRTLAKALDKFANVAPFLFVLAGTTLGFAPAIAFKAAVGFGTIAGLYLTLGKQLLVQMYPDVFGPEDLAAQVQPVQPNQAGNSPNPDPNPNLGQSSVPQQFDASAGQSAQPVVPTTATPVQGPLVPNFQRSQNQGGANQPQGQNPAIVQNVDTQTPRRNSPN